MSTSRVPRTVLRVLVGSSALAVALLGTVATESSAGQKGSLDVRLRDECDPATFKVLPPPASCVGDGDVTLGEVLATLNPVDFGHDKWRIQPSSAGVKSGTVVHVTNEGGETHTFTEVANFGPGIGGAPLDDVFAAGTPNATPLSGPDGWNVLPSGTSTDIVVVGSGTHLFMCLIHPWMETVITVK